MSGELPADILIVEKDSATHYILPRPALGMARMMGGALAAFGLAPIVMGVWFLREATGPIGPANDPFAVGQVLSLLFPSSFVLIGGLISLLGVWLLAGRSEIVLTPGEISSAFRLGPLAWRGRRPRGLVRRLVVERSSRGSGPGSELASLVAEPDAGRPLVLAFVYPVEWLAPLAAELARRWDAGEGPIPVVERTTAQATSRRWRRDRPAVGKRPVPGCFLFVWGGGFFAGGLLFFVLILQALLRGDPGNHLEGAYPWKCLWILFPLPFIVPGALALLHAFRRRKTAGLSPEQLRAVRRKTRATTEEAGAISPIFLVPEDEYPTVPAVNHGPGAELPVRLTQDLSAGCGVAVFLGLVLLCSGIITPLAAYAINQVRGGHLGGGTVPTAVFAIFLGLFWLKLVGALMKEARLWRVGYPVVEVSALPLYCGETYEVVVTVPGPVTLPRLRIAIMCEEEASYAEGEGTRKETRRTYDHELASRQNCVIERCDPLRVRGVFPVPPGAMHSFKAEHNEVRWLVRVEGNAQWLIRLSFCHDYRLAVRPQRGSEGAT